MFEPIKNLVFGQINTFMKTISTDYMTNMMVHNNSKSRFLTTSSNKNSKYYFLFYYFCLGTFIARMMFAALVLNEIVTFISPSNYLQIEQSIDYCLKLGVVDRHSTNVIWPLFLIVIAVDYVVHFQRQNGVWHCCTLAYELMVLNRENFWSLNEGLNYKQVCSRFIFKNDNLIKVTSQPLEHFPFLETSIRKKAVLFTLTLDFVGTIFYISYAFFAFLLVCFLYIFTIWPVYSFFQGLFLILNISFVAGSSFHFAKLGFFLGHLLNLFLYVLSNQIELSIKQLNYLLRQDKKQFLIIFKKLF